MLALERRGMISSLGERVKIALPREILFTGRAFITETMMSILCSKSDEKRSLFNNVSKLLKTRMLDSQKLENCSPPALGLMLQPGQGLLVAKETKVAWASVMISAGWAYLMKSTCKEEIKDLAERSCMGRQKKNPVQQSTPNSRDKVA